MRRRQGFTLVELLVAMALIVLIMAIISQAFVEGLETFRQLKGIGDLQEQLRTATVPLREDLMAQHLVASTGPVKLSQLGPPTNPVIQQGFFRIQQFSGSQPESQDSDGIMSSYATDHALLFTINTGAGSSSRRTNFLSVPLQSGGSTTTQTALAASGPPNFQDSNLLLSPWAEVAWFLVPMEEPDSTPANRKYVFAAGGSTQLFTLHRRIRLLVPNNGPVNATGETSDKIGLYPEVSCKPNPPSSPPGSTIPLYFNSPTDVLNPASRGGMTTDSNNALVIDRTPLGQLQNGVDLTGVDRALADVISFQVQYLTVGSYSFTDVSNGGVYDTAIPPAPTSPQIRALQITIRVWDAKTEQTRQITMIQDM